MDSVPITQSFPGETDAHDEPDCMHHWVIERPAGPASNGKCKLCGADKKFQNYIEGSSWGNDLTLSQLSGGSRFPIGINAPVQGNNRLDVEE